MSKIDFYLEKTEAYLQEAADLVQLEYEKEGYVSLLKSDEKSPISKYNKNEKSFTFVAKSNQSVLGTVTLVGDSDEGFPLDDIFKFEMDELRKQGGNCAEISQLVVRRDAAEMLGISERKVQLFILLPLFKAVYYCAKKNKINLLCITINPKHDNFYLSLGFRAVGEVKYYDTVNGAPALLRVLDLDTLSEMDSNVVMREIMRNPLDLKCSSLEQNLLFSVETS